MASRQKTRSVLFKSSIDTLFKHWQALKIAVENGQGGAYGKDIASWMVGATEDFFYTNDDLMGYEVAEFLGELMSQELDTICEDNSVEEIGDKLCRYFEMCKSNKEEELNKELEIIKNPALAPVAAKPMTNVENASDSSESSDSDEDMDAEDDER